MTKICDLNRSWVRGHLGFIDCWFEFLKKGVTEKLFWFQTEHYIVDLAILDFFLVYLQGRVYIFVHVFNRLSDAGHPRNIKYGKLS